MLLCQPLSQFQSNFIQTVPNMPFLNLVDFDFWKEKLKKIYKISISRSQINIQNTQHTKYAAYKKTQHIIYAAYKIRSIRNTQHTKYSACKELTPCLLGNFACIIVVCRFYFKINVFENFFQAECQIVWIQIRPDVLSGRIWVQIFCTSCQQTTLVGIKSYVPHCYASPLFLPDKYFPRAL